MGVKKKHRINMSKREFYKIKKSETSRNDVYLCDSVVILPTKKETCPGFTDFGVALFKEGYPLCRLDVTGDVLFMESSNMSYKIDIMSKSGLTNIFASVGRLAVVYDGCDIHIEHVD